MEFFLTFFICFIFIRSLYLRNVGTIGEFAFDHCYLKKLVFGG